MKNRGVTEHSKLYIYNGFDHRNSFLKLLEHRSANRNQKYFVHTKGKIHRNISNEKNSGHRVLLNQ